MIICLCDGSSLGNPGKAKIGVVIWHRWGKTDARRVKPNKTISEDIGIATNNDAEWQAVLRATRYCKENSKPNEYMFIYTDSLLVVRQINGEWKLKKDSMKKYFAEYAELSKDLNLKISWIPRQLTYLADEQTKLG